MCLSSVREGVHGRDIYYGPSQGSSGALFYCQASAAEGLFSEAASRVGRRGASNRCHSGIPLVSVRAFNVFASLSWKAASLISTGAHEPSARRKHATRMSARSYLVPWHLAVVSLEALWLSCQPPLVLLARLMPFFSPAAFYSSFTTSSGSKVNTEVTPTPECRASA